MEIELTKNYKAIIDAEDKSLVEGYMWYTHKVEGNTYARGYKIGRRAFGLIYMHRLIIGAKKGQIVDHKDRNGLNNSRGNLRICTKANNNINTLKRKGYWFDKNINKYRVETTYGKKKKYIGLAKTPEAARAMYVEYINSVTNNFLSIEGE